MTSPEAHVSRGEAAQAISNALVRLLRDYTGRGPTQALRNASTSRPVFSSMAPTRAAFIDHHIDPDIAVEVFILKPRRDHEVGSADGGGLDGASVA